MRSPAKAGAEKKAPNGKGVAPTDEKPRAPKAPRAADAAEPKVSQAELDALRKPVEEAKGALEKAQGEAKALAERARAVVAEAKDAYRATTRVIPACLPRPRRRQARSCSLLGLSRAELTPVPRRYRPTRQRFDLTQVP